MARRLRVELPQSGLPFKALREALHLAFRPLDWVITRAVGHSELVMVAGLKEPKWEPDYAIVQTSTPR